MKKRVLAGMLIALAVCSVTACGKNKDKEASSSVNSAITAETLDSEEQSALSQTPETSSQTPETSQTAGQTVSASISLDEDMASVSYVLLARMISEQEDNAAFDAESKENGETFWKEMNYLVSAYGVNNKQITFDEDSKEYSLKKAQLRYYAASLYSDLGKAKSLPDIADDSTSVTKKSSKWKFGMNDISAYNVSVQSCSKQDKDGTYRLGVYLVDSASQTSLGEYAAVIKKSPYTSSKSPFHYTIVSLSKMTKMDMETVLVGDQQEDTQDASQVGLTAGTQSSAAASSSGSSSQQYGQVLSMPGSSTDTSQSSQTGAASGTDTSQTASGTQTSGSDIAGATVTADAAMEIARKYYGAKASDGTEYQYKYEGTTTYQNVPYYNFSVTDGEKTVIHVLVSGDGARIYKGTNTNDSWTMQ